MARPVTSLLVDRPTTSLLAWRALLNLPLVKRWPGGVRAAMLTLPLAVGWVQGCARLAAAAPDSPSMPEIIAALASVDDAVTSLSGSLHLNATYTFGKPGAAMKPGMIEDDAVASTAVGDFTFECLLDGRGRIEADMVRTSIQIDGNKIPKHLQIVSVFDGKQGRFVETRLGDDGAAVHTIGRGTSTFLRPNLNPLDLATQHVGRPLSQLLAEGDANILRTEVLDDRPVVVVELAPQTVREDYIYQQRFWIDVERRVAVRRESMVQCGEGMPWALHYRVACGKYAEIDPGIWLPRRVEKWNYHVTTEGQDHLTAKDRIDVMEWKVNAEIAPERFEEKYPAGAHTDESSPDGLVPAKP